MSVLLVQQRSPEVKPKKLRREGFVPMALVEKGGNTILIQAPVNDLKKALAGAHGAGMIDLSLEGQKEHRSVMIKSIDRDVMSRSLNHVTVQQVAQDDMVKVDIPVIATGTPELVASGEAVLVHSTDHIKVRAKVSDVPDNVEVDISGLGLHDSITAGQLQLPEGVELLSSPDAQVFSVTIPKEPELEAPTEEATAEVPVVGEAESTEE